MSYSYDKKDRLIQVYEAGKLVATYTYDVNGNRSSLTYGNGNSVDYAYNLANLITSLNNKKGTINLSNYAYTYYLNGNQATKSDNKGRLTSYNYDGLGRLTKEAESGKADAITKSYTFDAPSNRASMTVSGAEAYKVGYKYDLNNRLATETKEKSGVTEITDYYYDNNGNTIVQKTGNLKNSNGNETLSLSLDFTGSELYSYDGFDRMVGVQNSSGSSIYTYKPDGLRISKTVNGVKTTQVWEGQDIALELDENGEVTNRYIRGIGLINSDKNGWYLFNAHGDVVQLADGTGNVTKEYLYDAFGNEKNTDANDTNPFRSCSEYFDKETSDIYLRARYYDSSIGRFISEDSFTGDVNDTLSLNLYTYCENNPVMYIDPTGNWVETDSKYSTTVQAELCLLPYVLPWIMCKYSTTVQAELLKLTTAWYMATSTKEKNNIHNRAEQIRNSVNSGVGLVADRAKSLSGAAADEFSGFLGGDVSKSDRDFWLAQVQQYDSKASVNQKNILKTSMACAGLLSPSPDDAVKYISKNALKQMNKQVDKNVQHKIFKSLTKYAGKQGASGIKKLKGNGIKGCMYEVKIKGDGGAYRMLGNKNKNGEIYWEYFEKTH